MLTYKGSDPPPKFNHGDRVVVVAGHHTGVIHHRRKYYATWEYGVLLDDGSPLIYWTTNPKLLTAA